MSANRWTGIAFGLAIDSGVPLPGLWPQPFEGGERQLSVRLADRDDLLGGWRQPEAERISSRRDDAGNLAVLIDAQPEFGYLFRVRGLGRFLLSPDGRDLRCAPDAGGEFTWERYVTAQVLPFASLLQGCEVLHASAVSVAGGAFGLIGDTGSGKSTLAVNLCALGAGFLTDDVLAVDVDGGRALAHSGLPWAKLRGVALDLVAEGAREHVSDWSDDLRLDFPKPASPQPLAGLYFLVPDGAVEGLVVEPVPVPDAETLLASTFNLVVDGPGRLVNQLQVCAAIAGQSELRYIRVPRRPGLGVAEALLDEMEKRMTVLGNPALWC